MIIAFHYLMLWFQIVIILNNAARTIDCAGARKLLIARAREHAANIAQQQQKQTDRVLSGSKMTSSAIPGLEGNYKSAGAYMDYFWSVCGNTLQWLLIIGVNQGLPSSTVGNIFYTVIYFRKLIFENF